MSVECVDRHWLRLDRRRNRLGFHYLEGAGGVEVVFVGLVHDPVPAALEGQHFVFLAVKQGKGRAFSDKSYNHGLPIVILLDLHFHASDVLEQ